MTSDDLCDSMSAPTPRLTPIVTPIVTPIRYAWAGHQGSYPGGKKDKYSVIFEAFDEGQSQVRTSDDL